MWRRTFLGTGLAMLALRPVILHAAFAWRSYSTEAFAADQAAGRTILVAVHAEWCPTCHRQTPILETVLSEPAFAEVVPMRVDFDADKEFLTAHRIVQQSTLLVFQGDREVARVIAETDPDRLRAFVADHAAA